MPPRLFPQRRLWWGEVEEEQEVLLSVLEGREKEGGYEGLTSSHCGERKSKAWRRAVEEGLEAVERGRDLECCILGVQEGRTKAASAEGMRRILGGERLTVSALTCSVRIRLSKTSI